MLIDMLYWLANVLVFIWATCLAISLWKKTYRLFIAAGLVLAGCIWHLIRALYSYSHGICQGIIGNEHLLLLANKCIPPFAADVLFAQVAVLTGLLVIAAELVRQHPSKP